MAENVDLAIVGAGPAGLAAALQARRKRIPLLVLGDDPPGGLLAAAYRLDNLPGFPGGVRGLDYVHLLRKQLVEHGIRFIHSQVYGAERIEDGFLLHFANEVCHCRTLILATGTRARPLPDRWDLPAGTERLYREARQFPPSLTGQNLAVIGGGETAFDGALEAFRHGAASVNLFMRDERPAVHPGLWRDFERLGGFLHTETRVEKIQVMTDGFELRRSAPAGETTFIARHLLVAIGREPERRLFDDLCPGDDLPNDVAGSIPGLFLAGDLIRLRHERFAAVAIGDGQRAACAACRFLQEGTQG